MKANNITKETVSVDEFKIEINPMGLSIVSNFNARYDYLFEYDVIKNTTKQLINISNFTDEEKLNLFDDCQSVLTDLRNYYLYNEDVIDEYTLDTIKKKYIDILDFLILLKPEIKEDQYLNKRSVRNLFDNAFKSVSRNATKQITENIVNKEFNKTLQLLNQEYEAKANFYTAAENKIVEKHYTEDIWFKVGLKYADGTLYDNKHKFEKQSKLIRFVFSEEYHKPVQNYISKSFDGFNKEKKRNLGNDSKNIFDRKNAKIELKRVYDYCIENGIEMHPMFIENYLLVQEF